MSQPQGKASDQPEYEVVWPLARRQVASGGPADRLNDLNGKTIALLWDMNFRGDEIYFHLRDHLVRQFPAIKFVDFDEFGNFHGPGAAPVIEALPGKLKDHGADAVIVGIGACGGCTPAVMRVAALVERMGLPSVSLVTTGFLKQAEVVAKGLGLPLQIVEYFGHPTVDTDEDLARKVLDRTAPDTQAALLAQIAPAAAEDAEPAPGSIVFRGTFDAVQDHFEANLWTDGLPIVPPTRDRVEAFLEFSDLPPDHVIASVPIEGREATIHSIAVTGVMAGCRPEYMPVLTAVIEAVCDPVFRLQSGGTTPGWEPLIIVNGPIAKTLGFHGGQGVMRLGPRANGSVARFLRLFLRNICGYRIPPGAGDKSSIGNGFLLAMAEDEDQAARIGWPSMSTGRGFAPGENVVTVRSVVAISPAIFSSGDKALDHVTEWQNVMTQAFTSWVHADFKHGVGHYLILASPLVAEVIAREMTKEHVRNHITAHAKLTAADVEHYAHAIGNRQYSLKAKVADGVIPARYHASDDPARLVDFFLTPEAIEIVVAGDADRNQSRAYMSNHNQGAPSSRAVRLPSGWDDKLAKARAGRARG